MKCDATDKPVLIIGYGNTLRGDDGVGWAAALRIKHQLPSELALVLTVTQLLPELAETISRAKLVIFIDANGQLLPGEYQKRILDADPQSAQTIGHHHSPGQMLRLAKDLYGHIPRTLLCTIGGSDYSLVDALSPAVQFALRDVVRDVVNSVIGC